MGDGERQCLGDVDLRPAACRRGPQRRIDPGTALPARSLVVYVDHPLRPHFVVEYAEWKLDAPVTAATFTLSRPQGVAEVSFRDAADSFR